MPGRIAQASDFVLPERQADRQLSRHDEPAKEIRLVGKCDPRQTMRSLIRNTEAYEHAIWCPTFSQGSKASTCRQLSWSRNWRCSWSCSRTAVVRFAGPGQAERGAASYVSRAPKWKSVRTGLAAGGRWIRTIGPSGRRTASLPLFEQF